MSLLPQEFIRLKRDGKPLNAADIADFVKGMTSESISEGQVAAFAMAVFFNGMASEEAVALTLAMRDSGDVLDWPDLDRPIADKHSTGGVGDNVSLMLAPIVAACDVSVPMISGRGLGHTGGTLDKMESIPGYQVMPENDLFRRTVKDVGCAIIGQTGRLAPADKRFYCIRDVTATVESVPLITASILSKKLAAGLGSLVLDVKCGNGAFMATPERAEELARSLVAVANGAGLATNALITAMDQPLASAAGNAVEVRNAIDFLAGHHRDPALNQITLALAAEMLLLSGRAASHGEAAERARDALESGKAAETFAAMVKMLGGPADIIEHAGKHLPKAAMERDVMASTSGIIGSIDTRGIGLAVVTLGGGRTTASDKIDPSVGLTQLVSVGQAVDEKTCLGRIHARTEDEANAAAAAVRAAYRIGEEKPDALPAIVKRITGN